jgi:CO/xanthine dehydrogenase Mo-binding subunit
MPAGAFRGYGATQGIFAVECILDELACQLDLDPIALKRKQLITPADTVLLGRDEHFHLVGSCGLETAVEQVVQILNYQPGMPPVVDGTKRRGVGFTLAMQGSGLAKIHPATARITLQPDGRYELRTGAVDVGTGSDTTLRQIAAEVLGTSVDRIDIVTADTHRTPFDAGSYASATLYISGQATRLAAQALRSRLLEVAGNLLNVPAATLDLQGADIRSANCSLDLPTLARSAAEQRKSLTVERDFAADRSSLTFAAQGVEVEVDTETGHVRLLRCVQALDIGKAINPRICEGQAVGGTAMRLGYALTEELRFDEQGNILNPSPRTYRIPLAKDVPPVEVFLVEQADPYGPFGAKGIGEISTNGTAPAIANAIAHATGVRLYQLPMTPERVWRALQNREGVRNR